MPKQPKRASRKRSKKKIKSKKKNPKCNTKVKKIIVKKIMTDKEISAKEGEHIDFSHYTQKKAHGVIKEDADVYTDTGELLLKFRKNVICKSITDKALDAYRKQAKVLHSNRGASSGVLDVHKLPNYVGKYVKPGKFRTKFVRKSDGKESKILTSNLSPSNIVGYYDKPDLNYVDSPPCRLTAFNRDHPTLWKQSLPFVKRCDQLFKQLVPGRHKIQKKKADGVKQFRIANTAFTTLTINYSWRTGLHKDSGDLDEGFGNLVVIEDHQNPHSYEGCYLGFPQYGICVDVRQGDFLAMNVHEWHANTEFIDLGGDTSKIKPRTLKNKWYFNRLSMVLYFRKNMTRCKKLKRSKQKPSKSRLQYKNTSYTKYL